MVELAPQQAGTGEEQRITLKAFCRYSGLRKQLKFSNRDRLTAISVNLFASRSPILRCRTADKGLSRCGFPAHAQPLASQL